MPALLELFELVRPAADRSGGPESGLYLEMDAFVVRTEA
jgi:hypothetical protein